MDGVGGIADYQCKQILGSRYHHLAPKFPLDDTAAWMKAHWF